MQTSLGMLNTVGQCLSILASFMFPAAEGPRFVKGTLLNVAFQAFGLGESSEPRIGEAKARL